MGENNASSLTDAEKAAARAATCFERIDDWGLVQADGERSL